MLDDFMLTARVPCRRLLSFTMAPCTQAWDIRGKRGRVGAQFSKDTVRPVTILAGRTVRIVLAHELPVYAHLILLCNLRVTGGTLHFLCDRLTRPEMRNADFGMALAT
jgi:hypothetical protein